MYCMRMSSKREETTTLGVDPLVAYIATRFWEYVKAFFMALGLVTMFRRLLKCCCSDEDDD